MKVYIITVRDRDNSEHSRHCVNHDKHYQRKWLAKHVQWALWNGYTVTTTRAPDNAVETR